MNWFKNVFGIFLEWSIQRWILWTGKKIKTKDAPWLVGPINFETKIGSEFYKKYAERENLSIHECATDKGLLDDFSALHSEDFDVSKVDPEIPEFYEKTANFSLDVWSQWYGIMSLGAKILISTVSKQIEQLNLPLSSLDTSQGMTSQVIQLRRENGEVAYTCWLRKVKATNQVVYAGFYTTCVPPKYGKPCVKVFFPLPCGYVTVILKPQLQADGSFKLISYGKKVGEPGYYRVHQVDEETIKIKYVPIKEVIHVYNDEEKVLRTDHEFRFFGMKLLKLHYKINRK